MQPAARDEEEPAARYRLRDLLFSVCGTVAFLTDLGSDMWSAVRYYKAGDTFWAALYIGLYVLSSVVLQLLSWGWYSVDAWQDWRLQEADGAPEAASTAVKHGASGGAAQRSAEYTVQTSINETGNGHTGNCSEDDSNVTSFSVMDAKPIKDTAQCPTEGAPTKPIGDTAPCPTEAAPTKPIGDTAPCPTEAAPTSGDPTAEDEFIVIDFCTSKIILRPSCFTLLHVLQLGYPLRCIQSLEVGLAAYRNPKDEQLKDYAFLLTHDISMMRLFETFLENTPQLILALYIIIQREAIQPFQCFSILVSFFCICWAMLDYHQSLRLFLKGKQKLRTCSSVFYYLWNFCLISSRILCIMLFTVVFHWLIALHFLVVCSVFFIWGTLQKTTFMQHKYLEYVYRATVAIILYFSWFNIADGRTIYRSIFYYVFIISDSIILIVSWRIFKFPSILDGYETHIIVATILFIVIGISFRLLYYIFLHPNVRSETKQYFDVPDGIKAAETNRCLQKVETRKITNSRMAYLAQKSS